MTLKTHRFQGRFYSDYNHRISLVPRNINGFLLRELRCHPPWKNQWTKLFSGANFTPQMLVFGNWKPLPLQTLKPTQTILLQYKHRTKKVQILILCRKMKSMRSLVRMYRIKTTPVRHQLQVARANLPTCCCIYCFSFLFLKCFSHGGAGNLYKVGE